MFPEMFKNKFSVQKIVQINFWTCKMSQCIQKIFEVNGGLFKTQFKNRKMKTENIFWGLKEQDMQK